MDDRLIAGISCTRPMKWRRGMIETQTKWLRASAQTRIHGTTCQTCFQTIDGTPLLEFVAPSYDRIGVEMHQRVIDTETVKSDVHGRILVTTITREEKRNTLNHEVTLGIDAAMNWLEDDPELWCGILTGGERVFSAGADLLDGPGDPTPRGGLVGLIGRVRSKPLIAAVEGAALGGGMELVLACDLVVASKSSTFGVPEPRLGLMPAFGGAFRLSRAVPANIANEMLLTGDRIDAERAERAGFVNVLCEDGDSLSSALRLATRICDNAPLAVREALAVAHEEVNGDETSSWLRSNAAHARLLETEDFQEGMAAFFARRSPEWKGR